jgi:hypothetical protein
VRKGTGAVAAILTMLAVGPVSAGAAVTLGGTESSNTACGVASSAEVQTFTGAGVNTYTVPSAGVVTSWQHSARDIDGALLKVKFFRPLGPITTDDVPFLVVGESAFQNVGEPVDHNFLTRIPVQVGDILGLATAGNAAASPPACNRSSGGSDFVHEGPDFSGSATLAGPGPAGTAFLLNISAKVEPDADRDGYGDETQDMCSTSATTQGVCPVTPPANKCKPKKKRKKKKQGSASAAKKKKKKKKKKKC